VRIERAVVTMTKIPVRRAHRMAIGTTLAQENIILRLYTDARRGPAHGWGVAEG